MMYDNEKHDAKKLWRGIVFATIFVIPIWVGVFLLTSWILK